LLHRIFSHSIDLESNRLQLTVHLAQDTQPTKFSAETIITDRSLDAVQGPDSGPEGDHTSRYTTEHGAPALSNLVSHSTEQARGAKIAKTTSSNVIKAGKGASVPVSLVLWNHHFLSHFSSTIVNNSNI